MANKVVKPLLTKHQQLKYNGVWKLSMDYEYRHKVRAKDVAEARD